MEGSDRNVDTSFSNLVSRNDSDFNKKTKTKQNKNSTTDTVFTLLMITYRNFSFEHYRITVNSDINKKR